MPDSEKKRKADLVADEVQGSKRTASSMPSTQPVHEVPDHTALQGAEQESSRSILRLEGLRALEKLSDFIPLTSGLSACSRSWALRVRESTIGGLTYRLLSAAGSLRARAVDLAISEIDALLPIMERAIRELCELWTQARDRLEQNHRRTLWQQLATDMGIPKGVTEHAHVLRVDSDAILAPMISVIGPIPAAGPAPANNNAGNVRAQAAAQAAAQNFATQAAAALPLGMLPPFLQMGAGAAAGVAAGAAPLPPGFGPALLGPGGLGGMLGGGVHIMAAPVIQAIPVQQPGQQAAGPAGIPQAAAAGIAVNTAAAVQQFITQLLQGNNPVPAPQQNAPAAPPGPANGIFNPPEAVRLTICRSVHFSIGQSRFCGCLNLTFAVDVRRDNPDKSSDAPSENLEVHSIEIELGEQRGSFEPLASASRFPVMPNAAQLFQQGGSSGSESLGPWRSTGIREIERRWADQRVQAFGAAGLELELHQFMRLMAALLGAALPPERVPSKRLWQTLRPSLLGGGPLGEPAVALGRSPTASTPLSPAELLSLPPFSEFAFN